MKNNPYVGPRPYEREDRHNFYGRKREARELRALIVAERVVLFYAQSGAGKTSLLNARVIPALEEKGFNVLPVARVGSELPPGIEPGAVENVFVFSALMALAGEETSPETLLGHTLRSFLEPFCPEPEENLSLQPDHSPAAPGVDCGPRRAKENSYNIEFESRPPVLILDQFEELFTTHRERWQDAKSFFRQVREALDALPSLGVVFAMREDHVAELDPYAPLFPRRLRARFRMERLGPKGALAAVAQPALKAGCRYDPGVAERLVDDLRRIKVIKVQRHAAPEGDGEAVVGPFVEPVQLQVVCQRLWENLPEQEDQAIQWEEVEEYGNIDRALTDFYKRALEAAVQETGVGERQARRWFGEQLITPMETRGLVLRGEEETAGLPNAAVDVMEKRHLIRADVRAGARWYELAHDRLVEPILESNQAWQDKHRSPLRLAAEAWLDSGKDPRKLYVGNQLKEAEAQAEANPEELTELEKEFIQEGRNAVDHQAAKRWRRIIFATVSAIIVLTLLTAWALLNAADARRQRDESNQRGTAIAEALDESEAAKETAEAEATAAAEAREDLAANLEAVLSAASATPEPTVATLTPSSTTTPGILVPLPPEPGPANTPTTTPTPTPDQAATATVVALQTVQKQLTQVRATQTAAALPGPSGKLGFMSKLNDNDYEIYQLDLDRNEVMRLTNSPKTDGWASWSPDGEKIAFNSMRNGTWEIYTMSKDGSNLANITNNPNEDWIPMWSSTGEQILFFSNRRGNYDIFVMDADGRNVRQLTDHPSDDWAPSFSPDDKKIVFMSQREGNWDIFLMDGDGSNIVRLTDDLGEDYAPDFSPDGTQIAFSATRDGDRDIYIMNVDGSNQHALTKNDAEDLDSAWSPDGKFIAFHSDLDGDKDIYIIAVDGTNLTNVTQNDVDDQYPSWLPK